MPWRIPEADIERVKRETDLAALAQSRGIELKKHGRDLIGRCPFHNDQGTPNFIVSPSKGLWHCMACGNAGNAIQFVQQHDGLSFRHAFEVLAHGQGAAFAARPLTKIGTVPYLPCPLDAEADDATLFAQAVAYYNQRLKCLETATTATARAYLASRGLDNDELIDRFQIGFADRTLGLRLPNKQRAEGERLRSRLIQLGLWRESGHEHFNGCIVVPFQDETGKAVSLYGRRAQRGDLKHLYLPGPHRGLFNPACFQEQEIILCEAVFDALTFWVNGFRNVTCLFGTEGFTDELWEAVKKVRRVRIAYDADDAGDRAAQRDAERFKAHGIEVFRVKFPHGMDANEYGNVTLHPNAAARLAQAVNSAEWMDGTRPPTASEGGSATGHAANRVQAPPAAPSLSLAASVSGSQETAAKEEKPIVAVVSAPSGALGAGTACLQQRDEAWFMELEGREYRVAGLEKTLGTDALKITLRLRVMGQGTALFHLDQVDLCRDSERRRFVERAAEETGLTADLLKRDMGRLLLAVEQAQVELSKPTEQAARVVQLSPEEREEALRWLAEPNLIDRWHDAIFETGLSVEEAKAWTSLPRSQKLSDRHRKEFQAVGWEFGQSVINVVHCPSCPKGATPDAGKVHTKAALEELLGDDEDGLAATFEDYRL